MPSKRSKNVSTPLWSTENVMLARVRTKAMAHLQKLAVRKDFHREPGRSAYHEKQLSKNLVKGIRQCAPIIKGHIIDQSSCHARNLLSVTTSAALQHFNYKALSYIKMKDIDKKGKKKKGKNKEKMYHVPKSIATEPLLVHDITFSDESSDDDVECIESASLGIKTLFLH